MSDRRRPAALLLAVGLAVGGCGGAGAPASGVPAATVAASLVPGPGAPSGSPPPAGSATAPASRSAGVSLAQPWARASLTDVRTGQPFTIADLVASGRVVFLEPMAVWCSKCRAQQEEAVAAFGRLDRSTVAWVGVDVETAESAEQLARYSAQHGFDFSYVISDRDLSRALVADFGEVVLNPPATNVIVIGLDGTIVHNTGHLGADELVALATAHGAAS